MKQRCDYIKKLKQKLLSPYHPKKSRCCKLLTVSRRRPLSNRNQSIDLLSKSMYWFLYDNVLRLERVKRVHCQDFYPSRVDEIIISDIFARQWLVCRQREQKSLSIMAHWYVVNFIFAFPQQPTNLIPLFFRINLKRSYFPPFILKKMVSSN